MYHYSTDWERANLEPDNSNGVITEVRGGGTPSTDEPDYWGGNILWLTPKEITNDKVPRYVATTERTITEKGMNSSNAKVLPPRTVMLSSRAPVGEVVINKVPMATNQGFLNFTCGNKLLPEFLYYWLKANRPYLDVVANGSTYPELFVSDLFEFQIGLPSIEEQRRITTILGRLDDKIELNQQINKSLEAIAEAIFERWIIDFEFPNEEGKPFRSSGGEMVYNEELGREIPKGWDVKPIDEIANFLNGLALQNYPPEDEGLPVIKIRELRQGASESSDRASSNIPSEYVVKDGDVLFSWSGSLELVIWTSGKGALNQHLFKVTSQKFPKWFYYQWILQHLPEYRRIAEGKATTMGHIQRHHLKGSLALVPDTATLQRMDKIQRAITEKLIQNGVESRSLVQVREMLLPKLMSGKIRVPVEIR